MESKIRKIYKQAQDELESKWQKDMLLSFNEIESIESEIDILKKSGSKAQLEKKQDELQKKKRDILMHDAHYKAMVEQTTEKLAHANDIAIKYINNEMPDIYTINYNDAYKDAVKGIKGISYELVDESTVKFLVNNDKLQLPKKSLNKRKDMRWNAKQINSSILQGILQGESIDKMSERILPIVNNNESASVRTARTLTTQCENKGRLDRIENLSEQGLIIEKTWVATNDDRTRDSHAELDGETVPYDEPFSNGLMYPGDPDADEPSEVYNCRCTMVTNIIGKK